MITLAVAAATMSTNITTTTSGLKTCTSRP